MPVPSRSETAQLSAAPLSKRQPLRDHPYIRDCIRERAEISDSGVERRRWRTVGKTFFVVKAWEGRPCRCKSGIEHGHFEHIREHCHWRYPVRRIPIHMLPDARFQSRFNDSSGGESGTESPRCDADCQPADRKCNYGHFPATKHTLPLAIFHQQHGLRPHSENYSSLALTAPISGFGES